MLGEKQGEEAIVSNFNEGEHDGGKVLEGGKEEEEDHSFSMKNFLWHGGSAWDAWFSCASNQVAQVLLTLPYSFSQLGMVSGIVFQIFYGLLGSWTAYLISVLYVEYRARKEKEGVNFKNHVIQWFEVLDGLLGPYWKAIGLAFNKSRNQVMGGMKNYRVVKISMALMIMLLLLVGVYLIYEPNGVHFLSRRGSRRYYTVVFDCGSTGTRVNVYEWLMEGGGMGRRSLPVLMRMYPDNVTKSEGCRYHCMQTEPGLDKFVGNATGVRGSLEPLIHWAEQWVPVGMRSETPIFVLATAGMRRLVEEDAKRILQDVERVVKQHGFMHRKSWMRVLSGREEAYYGWVALNYKMGVLGNSSRVSTLGLLDLGGSSLQLVAEADAPTEGEHILESQVGALKHHLLAYSLPAFGLNEAFDRTVVMLSHSQALRENADSAFEVSHPCLGSGFKRNYTCHVCFGTHSTTSENSKNNISSISLLGKPDWDICKALVRAAAINASNLELSYLGQNSSCNGLSSYEGNRLSLLTQASQSVSRYHALSAFFAVYSRFNLRPKANVTRMWERGEHLCSTAWVNNTIPHGGLYCFRAAYIASLIEDARCLTGNSEILFGPGDISWTLGAALVEGDYLWRNYTNSQTNWRLSSLDVKEMAMSSPFIIFVILFCLLVIVYYSQVKLPMPGTRRKGLIVTSGRSSSLPYFLGAKHQP